MSAIVCEQQLAQFRSKTLGTEIGSISQMSRKPIKKQLIGLIFLLLICLSMPLGAAAQQHRLRKISGDGQIGAPGQTLEPFVVEVRGQNGNPASGVFVAFIHDDGSLSTILDVTGADGRAESTLTLGSNTGTTTVTAQVGVVSITFEAKVALPPKTLVKISGDNQSGHTGISLARPFVVEVRDKDGDPLEDVTVTFTVTGGGGSLNPETTRTNSSGRAWSRLTLGDSPGTNSVRVSVSGISRIVVFSAEAALAPPPPVLLKISGDDQIGTPGQTLEPFVVEVRDQNGNPVSGFFVTFIHDSGSLSTILDVTNTDGRAESTLTLGSNTGTTTVTVHVGVVSVTFEVTVALPPRRLVKVSGDNQRGHIGASLARPFVVEVRDANGNPLERVTVTFTVRRGGGSLNPETTRTNSSGRAWSRLTLGNNPGTNSVRVSVSDISRRVVFNAEATIPPPPPVLLKISGDGQIGIPGQTLEPFVVEVQDQNGNPMAGVFVVFLHDNGSLNNVLTTTGADGRAESTLTLGSSTGTTTVTVQVRQVSVTFEATVILPPKTLVKIAGDNQSGYAGASLGRPFAVEVRDADNNPVGGIAVTFVVSAGGGSLNREMTRTNSNGRARSRLRLGNSPGINSVTVSVAGIAETVTFHAVAELLEFDLSLLAGISLIHVPLKVRTVDGVAGRIESVGDLYDALGGAETVNYLITYDPQTQEWRSYFGTADRGMPADKGLTDDTGILAGMLAPISIRLTGTALGTNGSSTITLNPGINLVGLPLMDSRITRVSDLFALGGIAGVVGSIVITDNGEFRLVGRAGDAGDIPVTGGGAFILIAAGGGTVTIIGDGWDNTQ